MDIPELDVEAFLAHHGVKGMRWGKRGGSKSSSKTIAPHAKNYTAGQVSHDLHKVGKKGVNRINHAVANGSSLKNARAAEHKSHHRKEMIKAGVLLGAGAALMYGPTVADHGMRVVNSATLLKQASNGRKHADQMMRDSRVGLTNYHTIRADYNPSTNAWG